jgi:hypothetical protein
VRNKFCTLEITQSLVFCYSSIDGLIPLSVFVVIFPVRSCYLSDLQTKKILISAAAKTDCSEQRF